MTIAVPHSATALLVSVEVWIRTSEDLEMRVCRDQNRGNEDILLEKLSYTFTDSTKKLTCS